MSHHMRGFSFTELMAVVAIIAIIATIALPAYNRHTIRSANNACLTETSAYVIAAVSALHDGVAVPAATAARCANIDTSAAGTAAAMGTITATARAPGDAQVTCNLAVAGGACSYTSASGN